MPSAHQIAEELFADLGFEVAILGSEEAKDLDLLVLAPSTDPEDLPSMTRRFLPLVPRLNDAFQLPIFVRQDHRALIPDDRKALHLLFYPTVFHLRSWEPQSFIAYVCERGRFVTGSSRCLSTFARKYRARRADRTTTDITQAHLTKYAELVVDSLVYVVSPEPRLPSCKLYDNFSYALRFALTEILISELPMSAKVEFWEWPGLVEAVALRFKNSDLAKTLNNRGHDRVALRGEKLRDFGVAVLDVIARREEGIAAFRC